MPSCEGSRRWLAVAVPTWRGSEREVVALEMWCHVLTAGMQFSYTIQEEKLRPEVPMPVGDGRSHGSGRIPMPLPYEGRHMADAEQMAPECRYTTR
jgi:hypothetical protein